ncbi:Iron-sulfur cluster assembly protein [uncultured archaeon]|nr:Iron-sulfur cluster assembly protein [uncultured archaeon]
MAPAIAKKGVLKSLSEIIDPELGINIVELGLIYEVKIGKGKKGEGAHVEVRMTLTSIGCPLAGFFAMQVEEKVKTMKGVKDVHVHVVWEPPWTPEMMSKKARAAMGMK